MGDRRGGALSGDGLELPDGHVLPRGVPRDAVAAVLDHPEGAKVYLVGVAHVSAQAARDVHDVILSVAPKVVVLELDPERFRLLMESAESGDVYGLRRYTRRGALTGLEVALTGKGLEYMLGLAYVIVGALAGAPAGAEFVAAKRAADQVGAKIVLADRDQRITLARLMWRARELRRATAVEEREPRRAPAPEAGARSEASGGAERVWRDEPDAAEPSGSGLGDPAEAAPAAAAGAEVAHWGQDAAELPAGRQKRGAGGMLDSWTSMLAAGGCREPDEVIASFKRILQAGTSKGGYIPPDDLLRVRECVRTMMEKTRSSAIKEGDVTMRSLEDRAMAHLKNAAGVAASQGALAQVLGAERDLILTRRLWEAALNGTTVGVVGAGHIAGIRANWARAGSPEVSRLVDEYLRPPAGAGIPGPAYGAPIVNTLLLGGATAVLLYRRPQVVKWVAGAALLLTAPVVGYTTVTVNRYRRLAEKLVQAAEQLQDPDADSVLTAVGGGPELVLPDK